MVVWLWVIGCVLFCGCSPESADSIEVAYREGKQLRAEENYEAAMQRFIDATHYHADDENMELLGRVYSNIADICQMAETYNLAYDMFMCSGDCFRKAGAMQRYYFALNNMALQRVQQIGRSGDAQPIAEAECLLRQIETECTDSAVQTKVLETRALEKCRAGVYDSALYYIRLAQTRGYNETAGYMIMAQSFTFMRQYDSARYYAHLLEHMPNSLNDKNNICYILLRSDTTSNSDELRHLAAMRGEVLHQKLAEQKSLSRAVELLVVDRTYTPKAPDRKMFRLLGVLLLALCVTGILLFMYRRRYSMQQKRLEDYCAVLNAMPDRQLLDTIYWQDYEAFCAFVDAHLNLLASKLRVHEPELKEREVRLCVLTLIGINNMRMAELLHYSETGIGKFKYLVAKKFDTTGKDLREVMSRLANK